MVEAVLACLEATASEGSQSLKGKCGADDTAAFEPRGHALGAGSGGDIDEGLRMRAEGDEKDEGSGSDQDKQE